MSQHTRRVHVHTSRQAIRWADMDALGHVNNTVYFQYMQQARIEWVQAVLLGQGAPQVLPTVIVNTSCTFLRPLVYPGDVDVRVLVGEPGRTSIGSYYEIVRAGELHAEGAAKIVWVDPATGRPVPLPAAILAAAESPATAAHR